MFLPLPALASCSQAATQRVPIVMVPLSGRAPLVVSNSRGGGAQLVTVAAPNTRLGLTGAVVFGIRDFATESGSFRFGAQQYANRVATCRAIAAWGGNHIRLRVLADEYDHLRFMGTREAYLTWVKNWVVAAKNAGLYTQICWWDSLDSSDSTKNGSHWATEYRYAFPMMTAVHRALRAPDGSDDPMVYYEPFNEPNGISWDQWLVAMKATIDLWRTKNRYAGVLMMDTIYWSHAYSDSYMSRLEAYDASRSASGRHNLVFCRHDYSDDYQGDSFDGTTWIGATGGTETKHVIHESEFGNSSGGSEAASLRWSRAACAYFAKQLFDRPNVSGATAFLYGPWPDNNRMAYSWPGTDRTAWGLAASTMLSARIPDEVPVIPSVASKPELSRSPPG